MRAAAMELTTTAVLVAARGHELNGAMKRAQACGPFFTAMDERLRALEREFSMAGTGFRTVARRLKEDAEREDAARRLELSRQENTPRER